MEGHEQIAAFIKRKKDLEKQTQIQQSEIDRLKEEVENLREELSSGKRRERFAALITLAQWAQRVCCGFHEVPTLILISLRELRAKNILWTVVQRHPQATA